MSNHFWGKMLQRAVKASASYFRQDRQTSRLGTPSTLRLARATPSGELRY